MEDKAVFQIFEQVECTKNKIVKIGHDQSLKKIWDIMQDQGLKMAALESKPDPENKIPAFVQGFLSYNDFLEFFVDNYDGDVKPFERTLTEIDLFYSKNNSESQNEIIKVVHKDEKLYVVIKKMLEYQISMIPVVQDMESKRTIGLFFLKDVFWLLRSGKYFDQPIHALLKAIYQDSQKDDSENDECEGEDDSDIDGYIFDAVDRDDQDFLNQLDIDSKQSASGSHNGRVRSFNMENGNRDLNQDSQILDNVVQNLGSSASDMNKVKSKDKFSKSLHNIVNHEETSVLLRKKSGISKQENTSRPKQFPSTDYMKIKKASYDSRTRKLKRRARGWSINSYKQEFISKKLVAKTKEIYGINRIAVFNRDCTLKE